MAEEWNQVPSVVLYEIYSFLPLEDKIRASSTCRQWRHVFYQSVTWNDIHFKIYSRNQNSCNRAQFLASCFGNKLRNAVISFESIDLASVEIMTEVLERINKNCHLRSIVLKPSHCTMEISEQHFLEKQVLDPLLAIIRNSRHLEMFSIGGLEELVLYAPEILRLLALHQTCSLQSLNLASLKPSPHHYDLCDLESTMFLPFQSLQELSLDYDYVSDKLLQVLCSGNRTGLRRLTLLVHGIETSHPGTANEAWLQFIMHNPQCELHLSLLFSLEAVDHLCSGLLQPAMPLTHFKALFCEKVNLEALHQLYEWYFPCLRSIWWVDITSVNEHITLGNNMQGPHPLIMAAWKCVNLDEIVFLGYDQLDDNIIAIARLRGSQLKRLDIAEHNIFYDDLLYGEDGVNQLVEEVSSSLRRMWAPLSMSELPRALASSCPSLEAAIEFAMPLVQNS